jgi:hypothetical protein
MKISVKYDIQYLQRKCSSPFLTFCIAQQSLLYHFMDKGIQWTGDFGGKIQQIWPSSKNLSQLDKKKKGTLKFGHSTKKGLG